MLELELLKSSKNYRICEPSFLKVPNPGCMGLLIFLVILPFGIFNLFFWYLVDFYGMKLPFVC